MRIDIQARKIEIVNLEEIPDINQNMRHINIEINYTTSRADFYKPSSLKSRHKISIIYYDEEDRKKEIGTIDLTVIVLITDENKEKLQEIFDIWNEKGYNEIPLEIRVSIENAISTIWPVVSIAAEKAVLPPPMQPLAFSPRPTVENLQK
ncbi:hypothetical protein IPdc08_00826 [archaeon]|nr:hypothetical protein IPdc08_00826 [archaeon]